MAACGHRAAWQGGARLHACTGLRHPSDGEVLQLFGMGAYQQE